MRSPWYFTVPSISLTVSNVAWLNFRGPPRCGGANQLSFVMDSQTYHDGMFSPWIPACDVLHSGKRWFSSFSLLDPSFSKRSASWTNFDLVVGDMYLKYWWRTLGLGLHRTTSFLAFFSIRNDQEWGRRTSCGQQNFSSPGLESLFVSQLNSRFELGSVRTESKFCYFEGF